jgi:hypothetical protein
MAPMESLDGNGLAGASLGVRSCVMVISSSARRPGIHAGLAITIDPDDFVVSDVSTGFV